VPLPVELAALEGTMHPALLAWAAARAEETGTGGDDVLRMRGALEPSFYASALARKLGVRTLEAFPKLSLSANAAIAAMESGRLHVIERHGTGYEIAAPSGVAIRRFAEELAADPSLAGRVRLTSREEFVRLCTTSASEELADHAAFGLLCNRPYLSAAAFHAMKTKIAFAILGAALSAAAITFPVAAFAAVTLFFMAVLGLWTALKFLASATRTAQTPAPMLGCRDLPVYTLLVPLRDEANMVPGLIESLSSLDYPPEKLDIKLIVEPGDSATLAAIRAVRLPRQFETVVATAIGPQTKPKALMSALATARGELVVIYDAEDRPAPDQLRKAAAIFASADSSLGCVQAELSIRNDHRWLTRHFDAEYAGLFGVLLPALAYYRLPLPLGGTSNHFRLQVLRDIGGWDPFNVTEDADLGMRLARFGYRTGTLRSFTSEEAPAGIVAWSKQRSRWMKGWLQTWFVHIRHPVLLWRELGPSGFVVFNLLAGAPVLAAIVHPLFLFGIGYKIASGDLLNDERPALALAADAGAFAFLVLGYAGSAILCREGMRQRGKRMRATTLLSIPLYWILLSAAALRAVWQFLVNRFHWEKTAHGLDEARARSRPPPR
jgi:cellulose synthase/poly-beta-1,6-N-acetylglucosamine synthase-like glycosyltransferase